VYFTGCLGLVMMIFASISHVAVIPVNQPQFVELAHNLPAEPGVFFITQFVRSVNAPDTVVVTRKKLRFPLSAINASASYKLLALKIQNGIAAGVWWVDNYVYDPSQLNIEFTSQGQSSGTGDQKSFTGRTTVNKAPVSRTVIAVGIDGEAPVFLARTYR